MTSQVCCNSDFLDSQFCIATSGNGNFTMVNWLPLVGNSTISSLKSPNGYCIPLSLFLAVQSGSSFATALFQQRMDTTAFSNADFLREVILTGILTHTGSGMHINMQFI